MSLPLSITLEEHFSSSIAQTSPNCKDDKITAFRPQLVEKLVDYHGARIENMDANGVQMQILSHVPSEGMTSAEVCASNDELAREIAKAPERFCGFAMLPMASVEAACDELQRAIQTLGFVGALIDNHHHGNFFDGAAWEPFWTTFVELDVPIYIHPAFPTDKMNEAFFSGGALDDKPMAASAIGAFGFGWHASTATTILRLLASGLFDRQPRLRIVIGHSGELLPYMFDRVDRATSATFKTQRPFSTVMRENIWITTSGMFDVHSLRLLLAVMPSDHVLFSVDYPFSDNAMGKACLQRIREAEMLDADKLEQFAAGNAVKLLFKGKQRETVSALLQRSA